MYFYSLLAFKKSGAIIEKSGFSWKNLIRIAWGHLSSEPSSGTFEMADTAGCPVPATPSCPPDTRPRCRLPSILPRGRSPSSVQPGGEATERPEPSPHPNPAGSWDSGCNSIEQRLYHFSSVLRPRVANDKQQGRRGRGSRPASASLSRGLSSRTSNFLAFLDPSTRQGPRHCSFGKCGKCTRPMFPNFKWPTRHCRDFCHFLVTLFNFVT